MTNNDAELADCEGTMKAEELQRLRELSEKATKGPWNVAADGEGILTEYKDSPRRPITRLMDTRLEWQTREERTANAELIAAMRNSLEELLAAEAQVERLEKALRMIYENSEECGCDHSTEDCCAIEGPFCALCISAQALAAPPAALKEPSK